jgi:hypothetical protein
MGAVFETVCSGGLTLAGFKPWLCLVDHVNAAFATHDPAITVPILKRPEGILDLHVRSPFSHDADGAFGFGCF